MKCLLIFLLAAADAIGQTETASIQGTVVDAKTRQLIPAALVMAVHTGPPPFTRNTRTGGGGEFQIQGLTAGNYTLCVQARGDGYLDPCQWNKSTSHGLRGPRWRGYFCPKRLPMSRDAAE